MFGLPHEHQHWLYVWIPLFGSFVWFGTLWAMLITWLASGRPQYVSQDGSIAYISDVGADFLKPLFVAGCAITAVSFFLSLSIERWLRHEGRLVANMRRRERVLSSLAIVGSFMGGSGLVLLSIFDTKRYTNLHRIFLLVFIVGVGLSAIFTVIEYRWISRSFVEIRKLKAAYAVKGSIAGILIILAVAFAVLLFASPDAGAIVEWTIAFGFTFYLLTFFWDLRMSKGVRRGELSRERLLAMQQRGQGLAAMREANEAGAGSPPSGLGGAHGTAAPNGYPQMGYATNGRAAQ
ncbi:Frag1/DRAM/Sfk1 family-domain-containing protein [Earliella scabrosa]|nr:Frag1/DRAM/Sfk1 family-domain-containing protein [Earliella scabrosa]